MAYTLQQLGDKVLQELDVWGSDDILAAALTTSATAMTVTDYTLFKSKMLVEIETEILRVAATAASVATSLTGGRAWHGSTATNHAINSLIRVKPTIYRRDINSIINQCVVAHLEKKTEDVSITTVLNQEKYTLPAAIKADKIIDIGIMDSDGTNVQGWIKKVVFHYGTGAAGVDQIEFVNTPTATRLIKIVYRGGFTEMTTLATANDISPSNEQTQLLPVWYACSQLLPRRENKRLMKDRNTFPEGSTPPTARLRDGQWYWEKFLNERKLAGLAPGRGGTLFTTR